MAARPPLQVVKDALDRAAPAPKLKRGRKEEEQRELPLLPAGCPVTPLGKLGQLCYYLDEAGQLIALKPGPEHGKGHILNLFGRQSHLCQSEPYWPKYSAKVDNEGNRILDGFKAELAAEQLMAACAHEGLFDPQGKVRGRGAWAGPNGELVLHCGDKIYRPSMPVGEGWQDPGKIDGYVYPTAPSMARPDPLAQDDSAGTELLGLVRKWFWERPKIDPYLAIGFIAMAPFGGALDWRSHIFVSGDTSTGKSALEKKLLMWLFEGSSLRTHQATEAAIRQVLGNQTLPVFFDEIEAEANSDRALKVIALARLASSEGVIFRGGSDHKAVEFTARSCFYFSSILIPPMLSQDRNRMAILELKPIPKGAIEPMIERPRMIELGRRLRRRVIEQWERWEETLAAYRAALASTGHQGRSGIQFGTLLAFADLLLYDAAPGMPRDGDEDGSLLMEWAEALRADTLAETADNASDSEEACHFLATSMLQLRGGDEPEPIARFIARAIGRDGADELAVRNARRRLENHGLRVVGLVDKGEGRFGVRDPASGDDLYVAIANSHEALARLFRDKRWADGVWSQTFSRVRLVNAAGEVIAEAKRRVQVRIAEKSTKATLVPIGALLDAEEGR